jgi:hypothetical protein
VNDLSTRPTATAHERGRWAFAVVVVDRVDINEIVLRPTVQEF